MIDFSKEDLHSLHINVKKRNKNENSEPYTRTEAKALE